MISLEVRYRLSIKRLHLGFASETAGKRCERGLQVVMVPHGAPLCYSPDFYVINFNTSIEILYNKKQKTTSTAPSRRTPHLTPSSQLNSRRVLASPANFSLKHVVSVDAISPGTTRGGGPAPLALPPLHTRAWKGCQWNERF